MTDLLICAAVLSLSFAEVRAQEAVGPTSRHAIYVEGFGNAATGSLNY
jgi:hypothetical protein